MIRADMQIVTAKIIACLYNTQYEKRTLCQFRYKHFEKPLIKTSSKLGALGFSWG